MEDEPRRHGATVTLVGSRRPWLRACVSSIHSCPPAWRVIAPRAHRLAPGRRSSSSPALSVVARLPAVTRARSLELAGPDRRVFLWGFSHEGFRPGVGVVLADVRQAVEIFIVRVFEARCIDNVGLHQRDG